MNKCQVLYQPHLAFCFHYKAVIVLLVFRTTDFTCPTVVMVLLFLRFFDFITSLAFMKSLFSYLHDLTTAYAYYDASILPVFCFPDFIGLLGRCYFHAYPISRLHTEALKHLFQRSFNFMTSLRAYDVVIFTLTQFRSFIRTL